MNSEIAKRNIPAGIDEFYISANEVKYNCALNHLHIPPKLLDTIPDYYQVKQTEVWRSALERNDDKIGTLAIWINDLIKELPGGVDFSHDVDGGGYTKSDIEPKMFTAWVPLADIPEIYGRFSQARTARHPFGALRSPVMGGVALEFTRNKSSDDPRDAVTIAIIEFPKDEDARYPWLEPRDGRLFDLSKYLDEPYSVGPLYNGHPNEIKNPQVIDSFIRTATSIIDQIVKAHIQN